MSTPVREVVGQLLALSGFFICVSLTQLHAEELCGEKVVGSRPGVLSVTEFTATSADPHLCPKGGDVLGATFPYEDHKPLFVWMRFEGDVSYLRSPQASAPLEYSVKKTGDDFTFNNFLKIREGKINTHDARREADANEIKRFDWRFDIEFETIPSPGQYTIAISQAGNEICRQSGPCQIVLNVR